MDRGEGKIACGYVDTASEAHQLIADHHRAQTGTPLPWPAIRVRGRPMTRRWSAAVYLILDLTVDTQKEAERPASAAHPSRQQREDHQPGRALDHTDSLDSSTRVTVMID